MSNFSSNNDTNEIMKDLSQHQKLKEFRAFMKIKSRKNTKT